MMCVYTYIHIYTLELMIGTCIINTCNINHILLYINVHVFVLINLLSLLSLQRAWTRPSPRSPATARPPTPSSLQLYLFLCLYISVYMYMYIYIYICICLCLCVYIYIYTYVYIPVYIYICIYIYIYIYTHIARPPAPSSPPSWSTTARSRTQKLPNILFLTSFM